MTTTSGHFARVRAGSIELATLKIATFALACALALWQFEGLYILIGTSPEPLAAYTVSTIALFSSVNVMMFVAVVLGRAGILFYALRLFGCALPVAVGLMAVFGPDPAGLWFAGFIGLPVVAFAMTYSTRASLMFMVIISVTVVGINTTFGERSLLIDVVASIGFTLITSFPYVVFASAAIQAARALDRIDEQSQNVALNATRVQARAEEIEGFSSLLHDHVLAGLSAIAKGMRPDNPLNASKADPSSSAPADPPELGKEVRSSTLETSSPYQLLGMDIVYSRGFGCVVALVLLMATLSYGREVSAGGILSYLLFLCAMPMLFAGNESRISEQRAAGVALILVSASVAGFWQHPAEYESWATYWQVSTVSIFAGLMAIRGRPAWSVVSVLGTAFAVEAIRATNRLPDLDISGARVLGHSILVAAAILVHVGIGSLMKQLPRAIADRRRAESRKTASEEIALQRQRKFQLLDREVNSIFDAARRLCPVPNALRVRASLTEKWLKDLVRAPLLNISSIRESVRAARLRGVSVQLLDDRTHAASDDSVSTVVSEEVIWNLRGVIIFAIDQAAPGTCITVRVTPPNRKVFLTVVGEAGSQRFSREGKEL